MKKGKKTSISHSVIASLKEGLAYARGKIALRSSVVAFPDKPPKKSKNAISKKH
jgi:hypothetical protein